MAQPELPYYCDYDICERSDNGLDLCIVGVDECAYVQALSSLVADIMECLAEGTVISQITFTVEEGWKRDAR